MVHYHLYCHLHIQLLYRVCIPHLMFNAHIVTCNFIILSSLTLAVADIYCTLVLSPWSMKWVSALNIILFFTDIFDLCHHYQVVKDSRVIIHWIIRFWKYRIMSNALDTDFCGLPWLYIVMFNLYLLCLS